MEDTIYATDVLGANSSVTEEDKSDRPSRHVEVTDTDEVVEIEDNFKERNVELHIRYLACADEIDKAQAAGDAVALRRAKNRQQDVANEFVRLNTRLAVSGASPMLIGDAKTKEEHLQAAMLGLWEAFIRWDHEKAAFSTLARYHISGRVQRSVRQAEPAFAGMSYGAYSDKPKVDAARRKLAEDLGRAPTFEEIAAEAGVTVSTVRSCSTATPVSLQTPMGDDGSMTLADLITDTEQGPEVQGSYEASESFVDRIWEMPTEDASVLLLRSGVTWYGSLLINRVADVLQTQRGSVQMLMDRAEQSLVSPLAVPADVTCEQCEKSFVYDRAGEPKLELKEFDVPQPRDDQLRSEFRAKLAVWTAMVNRKHDEQRAAHERKLTRFRKAQRDKAMKFRRKHDHG